MKHSLGFTVAAVLFSSLLFAEAPLAVPGVSSRSVQTLQSDFFEPAKPPAPAAPLAEGARHPAGISNYNSEQYDRWKRECKEKLETGTSQDFRDCVKQKKERELSALEQKKRQVEENQMRASKNIPAELLEGNRPPKDE